MASVAARLNACTEIERRLKRRFPRVTTLYVELSDYGSKVMVLCDKGLGHRQHTTAMHPIGANPDPATVDRLTRELGRDLLNTFYPHGLATPA